MESKRFIVLTELLMGAAYADERLEGEEDAAVRRLLARVIGSDDLPDEVNACIDDFDREGFDLDEVVGAFVADPAVQKRALLELVAAVFDADEEVDFDEDAYLRRLAEALGMDERDYGDLMLDYVVEDARQVAGQLMSIPPPPPRKR